MKYVIANLKANFDLEKANEYIKYMKKNNKDNVLYAVPYIYITNFINNGINTISQDVSSQNMGAFTGEVCASQLKSMGINYSLVGHSERRKNYQDDLYINDKIKRLLENDIVPILCIGENKEERDIHKTKDLLTNELINAFEGIDHNKLSKVIIAYEPIWSISTSGVGIVPSNEEISSTIQFIKDYVKKHYNFDAKVLYGGSVNNSCIDELEKIDNVDGYLVGGCSLKYLEFEKLINRIK